MGFTVAHGLILVLLIASTMAISMANNNTQTSKKIIVGGSAHWKYGFDYTKWAIEHGPFYINDTLVFKYDPPSANTFLHNVRLLPDLKSWNKCDFTNALKVADETQGAGDGFEFVLKKPGHPHFFACGQHEGIHCKNGTMKFFVKPISY